MDSQAWLEAVRKRLTRQLLPPGYVARFLEELADHRNDLDEEDGDAVARLGDPRQVADHAITAYRRRSFLGRHPWAAFLAFAVSPLVAFPILVTVLAISGYPIHCAGHAWGDTLGILSCSTLAITLYCELALRLGLGRKWMFVSAAVLGVFASLVELGMHQRVGLHPLMLPMQLAVPMAASGWYARWKPSPGYPATTFVVFALLPIVAYEILWVATVLTVPAMLFPVLADSSAFGQLLLGVGLLVLMVGGYSELARRSGWGRKWLIVSGLTLATFPVILLTMPVSLMFIGPTVVASFLFCTIAGRSGVGWKWMFVSCLALAGSAAVQSLQGHYFEYQDTHGQHHSCDWLMVGVLLAQVAIPLATGWWFLRRHRGTGSLQLAS